MKENEKTEEVSTSDSSEKVSKLFRGLSKAVTTALREEVEPETIARSVLHFAFMTNGQLADDYDLALKTASESLAISSEKVRQFLEENAKDEQEECEDDEEEKEGEVNGAPKGVTLH